MFKIISFLLTIALAVSDIMPNSNEIAYLYYPRFDYLLLPIAMEEYKKDPAILDVYNGGDFNHLQMERLIETNFLPLPNFVDVNNIKFGDIYVMFLVDELKLYHESDDLIFSLTRLGKSGEYEWEYYEIPHSGLYINEDPVMKSVDGIDVRGYYFADIYDSSRYGQITGYTNIIISSPFDNEYPDGSMVYRCYFDFEADGYVYELFAESTTPFEELWRNFGIIKYPLIQ